MDGFQKVGQIDELPPGKSMIVKINDRPIALFNVAGTVHAVDNECLHRQGPLAEGELEGHIVTCPWHGWQYDVRTGQNEFDLAIQLQTYDVQVEDGEVRVGLDPGVSAPRA